jgi:hypothetical protein
LVPTLNLDRRRWLNTGLASAVALSQAFIAGCSSEVERTFEYLQDVKLNDGKIITLRFKDVILARGKDTDNFKRLLKQEMWYEPLGIYYLDEPWNIDGAHRLMSFDIVNGVPMIVQIAKQKDMERAQGTKDCQLNYLKWIASDWIEVPESEFPIRTVRYNLNRATYERDASKVIEKRGLENVPKIGDMPPSMFEHSKGSFCHPPLPQNQNQNKETTK